MLARWKAFGLAAGAAVLALVPLYGDPRSTPVTHAEWARMLLRALQMADVLEASGQASQAFAILSWKNSLAYRAERYLRASGVELAEQPRRLLASSPAGEVVYPISVVRSGDYKLRVRIAGNPAAPAAAEITPLGTTKPVRTFRIVPASLPGWVDAGVAHLDPGAYTASLSLPAGTSLENVEVAPPCLNPIEPLDGWRATAIAQTGDIAVTTLKALDKESELPAAAPAIEVHGSDFRVVGTSAVSRPSSGDGVNSLWLKAGPLGLQAIVFVEVPEAGLYTLSTFGVEAGGQSWLADACRKAVVCGGQTPGRTNEPSWRTIMTVTLSSGRHFFSVTLGPSAAIERLRLERKKDTAADYIETLRRLGFDPGPDGPIARNKAVEAMNFIEGHRPEMPLQSCGDVIVASNTAGSAQGFAQPVGPVPGPPAPPLPSGTGPGPLSPPAIPPQQPASPVVP
jgi:hypothetical protein